MIARHRTILERRARLRRRHALDRRALQALAETIAAFYAIPCARLFDRSRGGERISWPRQILMTLAHEELFATKSAIGDWISREHSNVTYAIKTVHDLCDIDAHLRTEVEELRARARALTREPVKEAA